MPAVLSGLGVLIPLLPTFNLDASRCLQFNKQNFTADEMAKNIAEHVNKWKAAHPEWQSGKK